MKKYMLNTMVNWKGALVELVDYNYDNKTYTIQDRDGKRMSGVKEEELKHLIFND